jgi:prepilin-type N-terminal cleavage/methylation domain-containing protein
MYKNKKGLSVIEIIVAVAILSSLLTISLYSFFALNRRSAIDVSETKIKSVLSEARSKTLAGDAGTKYGVHFASSSITLFPSNTYSPDSPLNVVTQLDSKVTISNISITGGGLDIIFNRLTGETSQPGTITITGQDDIQKIITVYGTGIVE